VWNVRLWMMMMPIIITIPVIKYTRNRLLSKNVPQQISTTDRLMQKLFLILLRQYKFQWVNLWEVLAIVEILFVLCTPIPQQLQLFLEHICLWVAFNSNLVEIQMGTLNLMLDRYIFNAQMITLLWSQDRFSLLKIQIVL